MTNTPDRMARLFDGAAESFDAIYSGNKGPIGRFWDKATRANLQTRFDYTMHALAPIQGKRFLDVGCGPGRYGLELARRGAAMTVGLDVSPRMLDIARQSAAKAGVADRCDFVVGDIGQYAATVGGGNGGGGAGGFDAVIAMGFFDYVLNQSQVMSQLKSLSGNLIVASFPCLWALRVPVRKLWWKVRGWDIRLSTRHSVLQVCRDAGVKVVDLRRQGPLYLLTASVKP